MFGYIYKITNLLNNKIYIGKHKYNKLELDPAYITSGVAIKLAINKYGIDNFKQEIIDTAETNIELNEKEKYWILLYNTFSGNGYNLTAGGDGISEPSNEIIEINRIKHTGKKLSDETKAKRIAALKKVIHTKEWNEKISLANKGQFVSTELRLKSSLRHKNTKWYNDGLSEYMLFEDDPMIIEKNLIQGRLKNPFPNLTGHKKDQATLDKISKSKSNSTWYNNGQIEKMFKTTEIPEGFVKGRLKRNR